MPERTKEELETMLKRDFKRELQKMRKAAVEYIETQNEESMRKYKYISGRVDGIGNFALCAFSLNLFEWSDKENG